ncbi:ATP-binding protein [Prescottella agglutinans]|uniref:ATPase/DNA-binding CsgD family transcriptional regulator n=1 Tax=Prescottella agglutinans TaxID=1644129 RepID=A0ABT6MC82_9NOCA|nr:LuxR C-terminal-related transcriptional regulator [Prescottella agglutinans]MDH6281860.1 putative ATPase/DNA-binding CsgD family transcriptional regulator [Prescottella agglutinans]
MPTARAGNLPLDLTSFVGRRDDVAEVKRLLTASRLVTLTGVGGVGKTRLALRVAGDSQRAFSAGVWLVDLAELQDPDLVPDTAAAALDIQVLSTQPVTDLLIRHLEDRHLLLVLDNCAHLVEAVAGLVETLLRSCPQLHVLATSREPLRIQGEHLLQVPPLELPDTDGREPRREPSRYDAVALFVARARTAVPGFELTAENESEIVQICRRVDGLPLPIELATARLRAMSVHQILERLTDRYALLTGKTRGVPVRGVPTRQQTMRLCIDWSYELCTREERETWARLSVFAGAFELGAAEAICGIGTVDVLDMTTSLVDKSVLTREDAGGVVRYRLLDTLREYGLVRLREMDEYAVMRRRHRDWYEQLVLQLRRNWISPRQAEAKLRLEREQSNLREAIEFCLSTPGEADHGLRLAVALFPFWLSDGLLGEGRYWLDRTLDLQGGRPTVGQVKALSGACLLAGYQGDVAAGEEFAARGRDLAQRLGDATSEAVVLHAMGYLAAFSGDIPRAVEHLERALEVFRSERSFARQISTVLGLSIAHGLLGNTAEAENYYRQGLEITEARGESMYKGYAHCALGLGLWKTEPDRATELLEEALRLADRVDDKLSAAMCVEALVWIAAADRRDHRAAVLLGAVQTQWLAVGSAGVVAPTLQAYHRDAEHRARSALGDRAFSTDFQRGAGLSFEEAVGYALGEERVSPSGPPTTTDILTPRERQVADLVAQGLTDKAIAARLVVSPRTVHGHVQHALTKLGFTKRTQIAAWVIEQNRG